MSSSSQIYTVPLVYQHNNVSTLKQMLDVLDHLDQVSNNIFNHISQQVAKQKERMAAIQQRTARSKVHHSLMLSILLFFFLF